MRYFPLSIILLLFVSCGPTETKQKELELKEKELALKEKEIKLNKEENTKFDAIPNNQNSTLQVSIPIAKVAITRASNVVPQCNNDNAPTGTHPLIDLYCGALGHKPIELYITGIDVNTKLVYGYSIVGKSRTNFEGNFTEKKHKASSDQANNVIDVNSTIYTLILKEPSQVNKNGVFNLDIDISDIGRTGYGTWTSYDGMVYREIKIIDRLNDL